MKYEEINKLEINKIIDKNPNLPIYLTVGYKFRDPSTLDKKVTAQELQKTLNWMADVDVLSDRINIQCFLLTLEEQAANINRIANKLSDIIDKLDNDTLLNIDAVII